MEIHVLFFGALKDLVGSPEERVQVEDGSNVGQLYELYAARFPTLRRHEATLLFSRNREFVSQGERLREGDEVAFLPPVSGGAPESSGTDRLTFNVVCRLTREPIDAQALVSELVQSRDGALVVFEGVVRDNSAGRQTRFLEYEAYEPMALGKMEEIARGLLSLYPVDRIGIVHRLGRLEIGESSVVIVVTSPHRKPAFEACREAIDQLKRIVPIWKKEHFADGSHWVDGEFETVSRVAAETREVRRNT